MQVQGSHWQLSPHLQPFSAAMPISASASKYEMVGATPEIRAAELLEASPKSGNILHPPQPLPHLQADPQPQLPLQHDIFRYCFEEIFL
ncbi:hypothetical protein P5E39_16440, partial [Clostridium perfringens]|nr:hypothetical protein [Clostridium perfringens]